MDQGFGRVRQDIWTRTWRAAALMVVACATISAAMETAQGGPDTERRSVALALSGGGATGFAHIGVLQWLEQNRVPVDVVAGTSMGGLVGGLYAMGYSADEILDLMEGIQWRGLFVTEPPYDALEFRRKEDRRAYPVELQFGLRGRRLGLPGGLSPYEVDFLISRLTLPYSDVPDFDDLPIPFRCVAADIVQMRPVVLGHGPLPRALRATMAVPGVFTPVEQDGAQLIDGGVLNNLPVDVARRMGADIVVAVDLSAIQPPFEMGGINTVVKRTISTVVADSARRSGLEADIVLAPDTAEMTAADWSKLDALVRRGYEAAMERSGALEPLTLDADAWARHLARRHARKRDHVPVPVRIDILGTTPERAREIRERLGAHAQRPVEAASLRDDLIQILGSGLFESIWYGFALSDGAPVLEIHLQEKRYGPPFIDLAVFTRGAFAEEAGLAVGTRWTWFDKVGRGSELRADTVIGTEFHLLAEMYRPWRPNFFVAPALSFDQENGNIFDENGARVSAYRATEYSARADLGFTAGRSAEARFGVRAARQSAETRAGARLVSDLDGLVLASRAQVRYRAGDRAFLPRKGLTWDVRAEWYFRAPGADADFAQARAKVALTRPAAGSDIAFTFLSAGATLTGSPPLLQMFRMDDPFRIDRFGGDHFPDRHQLVWDVGYLKHVARTPLTGRDVYLGVWLQAGDTFSEWGLMTLDPGLSAGILSPTVAGPAYVGAAWSRGNDPVFFFGVGSLF